MIPQEEWRWYGNVAHLVVGHDCRFHLATKVGPWLVSTVGEYWPSRTSREIHAEVHDPAWLEEHRHLRGDRFNVAYYKRFGYQEVGSGRKYETMVFRAEEECECGCGLPRPTDWSELDVSGYNEPKDATEGHFAMCQKWALKEVE